MGTIHPFLPRGRWPLARCFREADDGGPRPLTIEDDPLVTLLLDCQKAGRSKMAQIVNRTVPPPPPRDVRHHLASGGDGIRSGIGLSLCQALGTDSKDCAPAAVCLELVHRTSLVFDDIQDRTPTRFCQPALWERYGIEQSLNAGHHRCITTANLHPHGFSR